MNQLVVMIFIILPLLGAIICYLFPTIASIFSKVALLVHFTFALLVFALYEGSSSYLLGNFPAPLGIELLFDGLSFLLILISSFIFLLTNFYASSYFLIEGKGSAGYRALSWFLLLGLDILFLSDDIFNIYVALEIIGLSAVGLSALKGSKEALSASLSYLFATLLGSGAYLLGVALIYGSYGTLSLTLLRELIEPNITTSVAFAFIAIGMMLKTALFPLHFWLPLAHSNAITPVSALLSALVIKASFYILYLFWFSFTIFGESAALIFGIAGCAGAIYGSILALIQDKVKKLIAYSTVAQVGYMFLLFPLAFWAEGDSIKFAKEGAVLLLVSHALAKAGMFLAAGAFIISAKSDYIRDFRGVGKALPLTVFGFALGGAAIIGLPPSLGFFAKWLMLTSSITAGHYMFILVFVLGGVLGAGYVFKVITALLQKNENVAPRALPITLQLSSFALSFSAFIAGFFSAYITEVVV